MVIVGKKIDFADLVKDAKSVVGLFSFPPISSRTERRHINTGWLPRLFPSGGLPGRFFQDEFNNFFRKACTSEAEPSVSGKADC